MMQNGPKLKNTSNNIEVNRGRKKQESTKNEKKNE
jgi:hypothetical protein